MNANTKLVYKSIFGAVVGFVIYGLYFFFLYQRFCYQSFGAVENITQMLLAKLSGQGAASFSETTRPLLWYLTISTSGILGAAVATILSRETQFSVVKSWIVAIYGIYGVVLLSLYLSSLWFFVLAPSSPKFSDTFVSGLLFMYGPLMFMSLIVLVVGIRLLLVNKKTAT